MRTTTVSMSSSLLHFRLSGSTSTRVRDLYAVRIKAQQVLNSSIVSHELVPQQFLINPWVLRLSRSSKEDLNFQHRASIYLAATRSDALVLHLAPTNESSQNINFPSQQTLPPLPCDGTNDPRAAINNISSCPTIWFKPRLNFFSKSDC